jgi:agmatinase
MAMSNKRSLKDILHDDDFYIDFHPQCFWPPQPAIEEAPFVLFGVPLDETTVSRPGSRYGPAAMRAATVNFDTYSERADVDLENVLIHDLGDILIAYGNVPETLRRVELILGDLSNAGKIPVMLGGEHTVTFGAAKAFENAAILDFDAHMDARNEYPEGMQLSHATFIRRLTETIPAERIFQVGIRTNCKEELTFARKEDLRFITAYEIYKNGPQKAIERIRDFLAKFSKVYLSIDIDVLDTPYTPGATYPSPEGISLSTLLDILMKTVDRKIVGFDLVEVSPPYDFGNITATNATKIILETIAFIHKARLK